MEHHQHYPSPSRELNDMKSTLSPGISEKWKSFSRAVFDDGALPSKTKQLIAVAVAHVTQCPYCIRSHTKQALRSGATGAELMEAIWVAAEMKAGAAYAHASIAMDEMNSRKSGTDR